MKQLWSLLNYVRYYATNLNSSVSGFEHAGAVDFF